METDVYHSKDSRRFLQFEETDRCPLCTDKSFKFRLKPDVYRCDRCRVLFRNPRPSQSEIIRSYDAGLTYSQWQEELAVREILWRNRLGLVLKYTNGGKLLDIGTGDGFFLSIIGTAYDAKATEISEAGAQFARKRGFEPIVGDFLDLEIDENSFDVITLWHVLEHVLAPGDLLAKINRSLRPGGIVAIAVPNERNALLFRGLKSHPLGSLRWGDEIHLTLFLPSVLREFLQRTNFEILEFGVDDVHVERPFKTKLLYHGNKLLNQLTGWHFDKAMYFICRKPGL